MESIDHPKAVVEAVVPQSCFPFAAGLNLEGPPPSNGAHGYEREIAELNKQIAINTVVVAEMVKTFSVTKENDSGVSEKLLELDKKIQELLIPMTKENQRLKNRDHDECFVKPLVLGLIEIVDRHSVELSATEKQAFGVVEEMRQLDREEIVQILKRLDIHQFQSKALKYDSSLHTVIEVRANSERRKEGHIAKVLRPGYRRASDGFIFRKIWVEVWGEKSGAREARSRGPM